MRNVNLRELNFDFPNYLEQFKKLLDNLFWEINFFNHKEFNSLIADSDRNFELDHSSAPNLDYDYFTDDKESWSIFWKMDSGDEILMKSNANYEDLREMIEKTGTKSW